MFKIFIIFILLVIGVVSLVKSRKQKNQLQQQGSHRKENGFFFLYRIVGWASLLLCLVFYLVFSIRIVDSGDVQVGRLFGKVDRSVLSEGIHLVNPAKTWTTINIQRNAIKADDGDEVPGMTSTTADNNQATVQANFTFMINSQYAWWLVKYIGGETKIKHELLEKSAQSATRDALAYFKLEDAQIRQRGQFEKKLQEEFFENILINLPKEKSLGPEELKKVFIILPTQLMDIKPDPKVANALAEKKATEINLEQQKTLTAIAAEQSNRRKEEGSGIKKLFDELPSNRSANDVALILNATANKTRAEALHKAVSEGKVTTVVFEGGSAGKVVQ